MRPILVDPKTGPPRLVIDGPGRRTGSWGWLLRCQPFEGTHGVPPGRALQTTPRRKKVALLVAEKRRHVERLVPGALEAAGSGRRDGRLARDLAVDAARRSRWRSRSLGSRRPSRRRSPRRR